jgi:1,2-diacylglycerol 3-alpha-glucosyltransferase
MRVLYALDTYKPNIDGVAVSHERIAQRLARRGHSVAVVAPARRMADYTETLDGLPVYRVKSLRMLSDRWRVPLLPLGGVQQAVRDFRPDVVVVSLPFILSRAALEVARTADVPTVGVTGTMPQWLTANLPVPKDLAERFEPAVWRAIAAYYERCDVVVGVTATALALLRQHGLTRPGQIISNGVSLRRFRPRRRDERLAARLGIGAGPTVLYAGRLDAEKGLDVWLRAVALTRRNGVDLQALLVGNGSEKRRLVRLAKELDLEQRVHFVGFLPPSDYERVFSLADVFAIASTAELQSIVALEAAASGLPLVAANAGALPELARDGYNGCLFAPGDVESMARQLTGLLAGDPRARQMGRRSRLVALHHDIEMTTSRYEDLFRDLVNRGAQSGRLLPGVAV